jgi:predicted transcriptional regulator
MSTLSVPLTPELEKQLMHLVATSGLSKADITRQALKRYSEEEAVAEVLRAMKEPSLEGDLRELMEQID